MTPSLQGHINLKQYQSMSTWAELAATEQLLALRLMSDTDLDTYPQKECNLMPTTAMFDKFEQQLPLEELLDLRIS